MKDFNQIAADIVKEATQDRKPKDTPKKKVSQVVKTKGAKLKKR